MIIQLTDPAGVVTNQIIAPNGSALTDMYIANYKWIHEEVDKQIRAALAVPGTATIKVRVIVA